MRKLSVKTKRRTAVDGFINYGLVTVSFIALQIMLSLDLLSNKMQSLLIPVCCYIVMAVSLNLTVGILGELSLGHAGFMSLGAFSGIITATALQPYLPSPLLRLVLAIAVGTVMGAVGGVVVGIPALRLRGDYLAIVTLAFGEIIKNIINVIYVGIDADGLQFAAKEANLHLLEDGVTIIKGPMGAVGVTKLSTFTMGFILILLTLIIVQNLVASRTGRAILALRDNRIAAESVGINVTKYKMIAFVTSAAMAGAAGALFGLNYSSTTAARFDFNTSILILVFVVLGGLGNIRGSIIAAALLYILPEMLRSFNIAEYRMLIYAVILILVMLMRNSPQLNQLLSRILPKSRKGDESNG